MVPLWLLTTVKSYLAIKLRLKRDKYLAFASLTDTNFVRTLVTISFNWFDGYKSIKHWKHSKSTALAPFLRLLAILEQTLSWDTIKISTKLLSNELVYFLRILSNFKIATCKKGSWTPPISYYVLCYWTIIL